MPTLPKLELSKDATDFIAEANIDKLLESSTPELSEIKAVVEKSLNKEALTLDETALLLKADQPEAIEMIFEAARELKRRVYGNRIVLFAPLYVGSECVNDCTYCSFRRSNPDAFRRTIEGEELAGQVKALEDAGHKRLILVFGEHPKYDAEFIAKSVRTAYETKSGHGEIRRLNINAAPLDHEGYKIVKESGIGTYQIFMETYHRETYAQAHPEATRKGDYMFRLDGLDRALEAGCDDVGIGALFGLYEWRYEVMGLVAHSLHLHNKYGVGAHTISFPRMRPAHGAETETEHMVSDDDFKRVIAILRLAVPYAGLICTAREAPELRREVMAFGVSQIDAGSRIDFGGYTEVGDAQCIEKGQFELGDIRPLDEVMRELMDNGYLPSFCTACYRLGRTGEHFMEFAVPGFIKRYCTPNALTTLMEYLVDYSSDETLISGEKLIKIELENIKDDKEREEVRERVRQIKEDGGRDMYV